VRLAVHIVDQGSSRENLAKLKAHIAGRPQVHLVELPNNTGVPAGRNIASRAGSAPTIVALDNDAEFGTTDVLLRAADLLKQEQDLAAIGFRIVDFDTGEDDPSSWGYPALDWERRALEFPATNVVGAGHAIRRQAFEEAGGYDDRLFFVGEEL